MMTLSEIGRRGRAIEALQAAAAEAEAELRAGMHAVKAAAREADADATALEELQQSDDWAYGVGAICEVGRSCPECLEPMERAGCGCGYAPGD
jgi:hypothetical protein